jgi:ISXO2-like transposase domain/Transposase zinc-ribbon domain
MVEPKSLQEAVLFFVDPDNCIEYLSQRRWPNGVVMCPTCGSEKVKFNQDRRIWQCSTHHPKRQFSIKVGTIFEDSAIGLDRWMVAVWMLTNCKNGISSYELAKAVNVTQKTGWFMLHRIRLALKEGTFTTKMGGDGSPVEVDETYIGGKARNMHKSRKIRLIKAKNDLGTAYVGTNTGNLPGKTPVQGMLDRESRKVRATVLPNIRRDTLQAAILNQVAPGTMVCTDQAVAYDGLAKNYVHEVINHLQGYVRGKVHTNGIENFWSLLKRGLNGTYVSVEPFHLFRYVDEQVFRYNYRKDGKRKLTDAERFDIAISQIVGKRLTFAELTGKVGAAATF